MLFIWKKSHFKKGCMFYEKLKVEEGAIQRHANIVEKQ